MILYFLNNIYAMETYDTCSSCSDIYSSEEEIEQKCIKLEKKFNLLKGQPIKMNDAYHDVTSLKLNIEDNGKVFTFETNIKDKQYTAEKKLLFDMNILLDLDEMIYLPLQCKEFVTNELNINVNTDVLDNFSYVKSIGIKYGNYIKYIPLEKLPTFQDNITHKIDDSFIRSDEYSVINLTQRKSSSLYDTSYQEALITALQELSLEIDAIEIDEYYILDKSNNIKYSILYDQNNGNDILCVENMSEISNQYKDEIKNLPKIYSEVAQNRKEYWEKYGRSVNRAIDKSYQTYECVPCYNILGKTNTIKESEESYAYTRQSMKTWVPILSKIQQPFCFVALDPNKILQDHRAKYFIAALDQTDDHFSISGKYYILTIKRIYNKKHGEDKLAWCEFIEEKEKK